jgi:hypothetical protein
MSDLERPQAYHAIPFVEPLLLGEQKPWSLNEGSQQRADGRRLFSLASTDSNSFLAVILLQFVWSFLLTQHHRLESAVLCLGCACAEATRCLCRHPDSADRLCCSSLQDVCSLSYCCIHLISLRAFSRHPASLRRHRLLFLRNREPSGGRSRRIFSPTVRNASPSFTQRSVT